MTVPLKTTYGCTVCGSMLIFVLLMTVHLNGCFEVCTLMVLLLVTVHKLFC